MENPTTFAVDLSKDLFEVAMERDGRVVERKRLRRKQLAAYFSEKPAATVVMEACGSSHHWGRVIGGLGHRVELLPAQHVSKCRIGEKTDRRDVGAILSARRRPDIVPVPVKSVEQQAVCSLHRVRAALTKTRTARLNLLRGLLREFGVAIPQGAARVLPLVREALAEGSVVPEAVHPALLAVMEEVGRLEEGIAGVERQLASVGRQLPLVERLETIPGIGLLNATAFSAMVGDLGRYPTGRRADAQGALERQEEVAGVDQQGRQPLSQDASDLRSPQRAAVGAPGQAAQPAPAVGARGREKAGAQPRSRRRRQQAGAHRVGGFDARSSVSGHPGTDRERHELNRKEGFPPTNAKVARDEIGRTDTGESR